LRERVQKKSINKVSTERDCRKSSRPEESDDRHVNEDPIRRNACQLDRVDKALGKQKGVSGLEGCDAEVRDSITANQPDEQYAKRSSHGPGSVAVILMQLVSAGARSRRIYKFMTRQDHASD
jgi:hypothetical protein